MKRRAYNDKVRISGIDVSPWVERYEIVAAVGDVYTVRLTMHADDSLTINGRTIAQMLGHEEEQTRD